MTPTDPATRRQRSGVRWGARRRKSGASTRRFTLLELAVALIVFTMLAGVLFGFSREVTRSWGRLQAEQRRFAGLMALDRALDSILANAVPFMWRDEDNVPALLFLGESDRLRLAYLHQINNVEDGGLRFLELRVRDNRLEAVYRERPSLDWEEDAEFAKVSLLADNVEEVLFEYADWIKDEGIDWVDEWDPERKDMPLAVIVQVRWQDGRVESWLRRTAGAGFHERWGKWEPHSPLEGI